MEWSSPLVNEISSLEATVHFAIIQMKENKSIRDQIINLLIAPGDWADITFCNAPSIRKQFNSDYGRKQYLKRKNRIG